MLPHRPATIVIFANFTLIPPRAMFTHDMVESKQPDITMHSIDSGALESLINFAYSGRVSITTSNVQNLMLGASFLQVSCLPLPHPSHPP